MCGSQVLQTVNMTILLLYMYIALGGIKKYQIRYIANIIPRYYGIPSLKVIVGH